MPSMTYRLRWPDRSETDCYSPSLVIRDFFEAGQTYTLPLFMTKLREATCIASDRVKAKYGFPCSRAEGQLRVIEQIATRFAGQPEAGVQVVEFGDPF